MSATKKKVTSEKSENRIEGLKEYFKGVKSEWGKITWPERPQVINETIVVLVIVVIFTVLVFSFDSIFGTILQWLLGIFSNR